MILLEPDLILDEAKQNMIINSASVQRAGIMTSLYYLQTSQPSKSVAGTDHMTSSYLSIRKHMMSVHINKSVAFDY